MTAEDWSPTPAGEAYSPPGSVNRPRHVTHRGQYRWAQVSINSPYITRLREPGAAIALLTVATAVGSAALACVPSGGLGLLIVALLAVQVLVLTRGRPAAQAQIIMGAVCLTRILVIGGVEVEVSLLAALIFAPGLFAAWRRQRIPRPIAVGALLLLCGQAAAATGAMNVMTAALGVLRWALVLNLALAVYATIASGAATLSRYAMTLTVAGGIVAGIGWLQVIGVYLPLIGEPYTSLPDSTFGYYSNYANFIAIAAIVAIGVVMEGARGRRYGQMSLAVICAIACGTQLIVAASRGALILASIAVVVLVAASVNYPGRLFARSVGLAAIAGLLYWATPPDKITAAVARFFEVQSGDVVRYSLQHVGLDLAQNHPLGLGWGGFRELTTSGAIQVLQPLAHAHNTFTQIALDGGWASIAGYGLMVAYSLLSGLKSIRRYGGARLPVVFFAALVGALVQQWNDVFLFELGSMMVLMLLIVGSVGPSAVTAPELSLHFSAVDVGHPAAGLSRNRP